MNRALFCLGGPGWVERRGSRMGHRNGGKWRRVLPRPRYHGFPWSLSQELYDFFKDRNCVTFILKCALVSLVFQFPANAFQRNWTIGEGRLEVVSHPPTSLLNQLFPRPPPGPAFRFRTFCWFLFNQDLTPSQPHHSSSHSHPHTPTGTLSSQTQGEAHLYQHAPLLSQVAGTFQIMALIGPTILDFTDHSYFKRQIAKQRFFQLKR